MDIRSVSLDGSRIKRVVHKNTKNVIAIALHYARKLIFWSDSFMGKIFSTSMGGSGKDEKEFARSLSPKGLSVDWVSEKLYWLNSLSNGEIKDLFTKFSSPFLAMLSSSDVGI